jgi:uncharacterized protein YqgQ
MSLEEGASLTLITIMVGVTTAIMATFTVYFRKKTYDVANKQIQLTALMEVFRLLNNESHRKARQIVYKRHRDALDGKSQNDDDVHQEIAMVRSDFDMIGTFIRNKLLSTDVFLDAYWDTTLVCWNALKENIMAERKMRSNNHYMANFEYLAGVAKEYKEKYAPRESVQPF